MIHPIFAFIALGGVAVAFDYFCGRPGTHYCLTAFLLMTAALNVVRS